VSKLRKTSPTTAGRLRGHLTFVSDCAPAARCLVARREVALGIEHCALSAMLTVYQLSKSFAGRAFFDDVSLQVNRGDLIKFQSPIH
jgi:hypothetical protein